MIEIKDTVLKDILADFTKLHIDDYYNRFDGIYYSNKVFGKHEIAVTDGKVLYLFVADSEFADTLEIDTLYKIMKSGKELFLNKTENRFPDYSKVFPSIDDMILAEKIPYLHKKTEYGYNTIFIGNIYFESKRLINYKHLLSPPMGSYNLWYYDNPEKPILLKSHRSGYDFYAVIMPLGKD